MKNQFSSTRLALTALVVTAVIAGCNSGTTTVSSNDDPATAPLLDEPNQAPTAANACLQKAVANGTLIGQLADHANDPDGEVLQYSLSADASKGTVEIDLSSGQFIYRPTNGERGYRDFFQYRVTDADGDTADATVSVIVGERRIMPFGDSITAGVTNYTGITGDLPLIPTRVGYRQRLKNQLTNDGFAVDFVGSERAGADAGLADADHQGHPGFKTDALTANVSAWLTENPADVMLIHVGTNDLSRNAAPVELLLQEIANWATLNHPVEVLVSTIIDHHADTFWDDVVEDFNADLVQRLDTNWPDAVQVDAYSALDNVADMSPLNIDSVGLHPNASGYRKMADTWLAALKSAASVEKCT